jgi:hypothetical protein|tara:strand:- start:408 stop:590 length:183 start_codon:yes stop_codon:yes gene_type:complete
MKLSNWKDNKPIDRDEYITNKENELFELLGITDTKESDRAKGLLNEIVQHLIVRTDNIFS